MKLNEALERAKKFHRPFKRIKSDKWIWFQHADSVKVSDAIAEDWIVQPREKSINEKELRLSIIDACKTKLTGTESERISKIVLNEYFPDEQYEEKAKII